MQGRGGLYGNDDGSLSCWWAGIKAGGEEQQSPQCKAEVACIGTMMGHRSVDGEVSKQQERVNERSSPCKEEVACMGTMTDDRSLGGQASKQKGRAAVIILQGRSGWVVVLLVGR